MTFIDIERRTVKGRGFNDPDKSSLVIYKGGLQVIGNLPHAALFKPATSKDRDTLVSYLQDLKYPGRASEVTT